jgi:N-acetylglucosamine malate deacetylase 2
MSKSILMVFAHPDDESFGCSGTIAKYSKQEIPVDLICATRGEMGTRADVPKGIPTGTAREGELRAATKITGIRNIYLLGYIDASLEKADQQEVKGKVLDIMRKVEPEVVITFGSDGISGHADHIAIGKAATEAFKEYAQKNGAGPRLYYVTLPQSIIDKSESDITGRPDGEVTTSIDIGKFFDIKMSAIAAHNSQLDAREFVEMLRQEKDSPFAKKEYYYRVMPKTTGKETDLFPG